ncbi:MAG: GTP 3',8-cyclase MoaA [Planctomycetota bacterium]|nr:MAG: GTP 3',8-cyclase MoaA [Planctomycetota bacterium]
MRPLPVSRPSAARIGFVRDLLNRPLRSLRLSVTDRCNLRCRYCMPEAHYEWLPRENLLSFEELTAVVDAAAGLGADRVRLTGGEPLLRRDLPALLRRLAAVEGLRDLALTTNGLLLADLAAPLAAAGLRRITVSLDTLSPERYRALTGRDALPRVLAGLEAAAAAGFAELKLNTVVLAGQNDDELPSIVAFAKEIGAEPRFIEYMDVGGATSWTPGAVVSREGILRRLEAAFGPVEALAKTSAPAQRHRLLDGTVVGVIASTTDPFCARCDRARLTADGVLFTCLYARSGIPLRDALRRGEDPAALLRAAWSRRTDRGAEERLRLGRSRLPLAPASALREDPHLEMHTRGG